MSKRQRMLRQKRIPRTSRKKLRIAVRHRKNAEKARKVLRKMRSFSEPHRTARVLSYLRKINPFVFEELLLCAFQEHGYRAMRNKSYSGDGGVDGRIYDQQGNRILIQAKRYSGYVNARHVRDFSRLVSRTRASRGIFIHTGRTGPASYHKSAKNVRILSGARLVDLVLKPDEQSITTNVRPNGGGTYVKPLAARPRVLVQGARNIEP